MNLYQQKSHIKKILAVFAVLICIATLYYTNILVQKISKREQRQIELYASGQHFIANSNGDGISFVFDEIIKPNSSIPVIVTDENFNPTATFKNIDIPKNANEEQIESILKNEISEMLSQHKPIKIAEDEDLTRYVLYKDSKLLTQLKYYPIVQLAIVASFIFISYLAFSYSRRSEQNNVWVGMSKETAHQLGTPLSSLMGWLDYLKNSEKFKGEMVVVELEKDIQRLELITERFSNIGSSPSLEAHNLSEKIEKYISYFQKRVSQKIKFSIESEIEKPIVNLNTSLFEWVLENLCKNAIDAMDGEGAINIRIYKEKDKIAINIADTGPGMSSEQRKQVFNPGFTTKKRGWGLGLTLSKRIIEEYHKGKLWVKKSNNEGTTFQILLDKNHSNNSIK